MKGVTSKLAALLFPLSAFLFSVSSCSDDDAFVPAYITDFIMAETDSAGKVRSIVLEDGRRMELKEPELKAQAKDSAYRCIATYTFEGDGVAIHDISSVVSSFPHPADSFGVSRDELPHDPVELTSIWKGRGFVNMKLGVRTMGYGRHFYAFSIDSVVGGKEFISLVHQRSKQDIESYTSNVYLSLPTYQKPDSITHFIFSLKTYDGWKTYTFE